MKFGFSATARGPLAQPEIMTKIVQYAEKLGFHAVTVGDHIVFPHKVRSTYPYSETGEAPASFFPGEWQDPLTVLSFIAAKTSRLRLITSILVLPYRHPLLTAKILATIDVLSKGRLTVGVGVGWMKEEFEALRVQPFEERGLVSDEYLHIFKEVWTSENPRFKGKYFRFSKIRFLPKPLQKPHPPIWVGGESNRALKRAAELGNGWYPIGSNPNFPLKNVEQMKETIRKLASYASKAKRDPKDLQIGYQSPTYGIMETSSLEKQPPALFVGDVAKIVSDIRSFEDIGVSFLSFNLLGSTLEETKSKLQIFSREIIRRV